MIGLGEDSQHQYKRNVTNAEGLAADMVAFSNGNGGYLFIGVDNDGTITGLSDKDISREEIQRMFQKSGLIHADELPVKGVTAADLDLDYFKTFFQKRFGRNLDDEMLPLVKILENMNLLKDEDLVVSSTLLFAKTPQFKLPVYIVKAGAFNATTLDTTQYLD